MELAQLEETLVSAIDEAISKGYTIVDDIWGDSSVKCCCAIGALQIQSGRNFDGMSFHNYENLFPSIHLFWDFIHGFMGVNGINEYYQLGNKLRKKYKPLKEASIR